MAQLGNDNSRQAAQTFRDQRLPRVNARGISMVLALSRLLLLVQYAVGKFPIFTDAFARRRTTNRILFSIFSRQRPNTTFTPDPHGPAPILFDLFFWCLHRHRLWQPRGLSDTNTSNRDSKTRTMVPTYTGGDGIAFCSLAASRICAVFNGIGLCPKRDALYHHVRLFPF